MTAPLKTIGGSGEIADVMHDLGRSARAAARAVMLATSAQKDAALAAMAQAVRMRPGPSLPPMPRTWPSQGATAPAPPSSTA